MPSKDKSLFGQYQEESYGRDIIETPSGFVTFEIREQVCCIIDVFIIEEARRTGAFYKICKLVLDLALAQDCKKIVSWIPLESRTANTSLKAQLSLGMKVVAAERNVIRLEKDI